MFLLAVARYAWKVNASREVFHQNGKSQLPTLEGSPGSPRFLWRKSVQKIQKKTSARHHLALGIYEKNHSKRSDSEGFNSHPLWNSVFSVNLHESKTAMLPEHHQIQSKFHDTMMMMF